MDPASTEFARSSTPFYLVRCHCPPPATFPWSIKATTMMRYKSTCARNPHLVPLSQTRPLNLMTCRPLPLNQAPASPSMKHRSPLKSKLKSTSPQHHPRKVVLLQQRRSPIYRTTPVPPLPPQLATQEPVLVKLPHLPNKLLKQLCVGHVRRIHRLRIYRFRSPIPHKQSNRLGFIACRIQMAATFFLHFSRETIYFKPIPICFES